MTKFKPDQLILRDHLAIERTVLANERTLLAYIRTSIGSLVLGITMLKLFSDHFSLFVGLVSIFSTMVILVIGFVRYEKAYALIRNGTYNESEAIKVAAWLWNKIRRIV